jgi:hypothetical protein
MIMNASGLVIDQTAIHLDAINKAHQRTFAVIVISFVFGG